jgi:hypothetical protein
MRRKIQPLMMVIGLVCSGCDLDVPYAWHAVTDQLGQTLAAVPIEDAINSANLTDEQIRD